MQALASAVNYWPDSKCARAFWGQQEIPAYRRLLAHTTAWMEPALGERWLDLGCGCGQLSQALWVKSGGTLAEIVGLDCAAVNEKAFAKLVGEVEPKPPQGCIHFVHADFSTGLARWQDNTFAGAVSGMAIQYAESFCPETGCWTTEAYDLLLADIHRVLRPNGWFVFSVNVPEPSWNRVALQSLLGMFQTRKPGRYLKNSWRMMRYGSWLKREARLGRFHYLPIETVCDKLAAAGFGSIEHRLSYAGQAYLIRCRKA